MKKINVEAVEKYINANTKILHHCLTHDVYWRTSPSAVLTGRGCHMCRSDKIKKKNAKMEQDYIKEISEVNPNIKLIGKYNGVEDKTLHLCIVHNIKWNVLPSCILRGQGCKQCGYDILRKSHLKTHDEYIRELKAVNDKVECIEEYQGANVPILHKCLIDGLEWNVRPANILSGKGCPKCGGNYRKSNDDYLKEVADKNPDIEVVGIYKNAKTPILHRCKICEHEWNAAPSDILHGKGCSQCKQSYGEKKIRHWLTDNEISYESQKRFSDCADDRPLPFDFYLPDYNSIIEYDGIQHFNPIDYFGGKEAHELLKHHDTIKSDYCKNKGIRLLRIPYYKFDNIETELNNFLFI